MRISLLSRQLPNPNGSAADKVLLALGSGLVSAGHDLDVCSWNPGPAEFDLPAWCRHEPLPSASLLSMKLRALTSPRGDVLRSGWRPRDGALAAADELESWRAVAAQAPGRAGVLTVHYSPVLDSRVVPKGLGLVQWRRIEGAVRRQAGRVVATSPRVAAHFASQGLTAVAVPVAFDAPEEALEAVEGPVVGMIADWSWQPNQAALRVLLKAWPLIRAEVPAARLLLAGRGELSVGVMEGVETVGEVASSRDFLASLAVLAFPCPDSSGPKIKVLESVALGLPVVTTPAGVEGLVLDHDLLWIASADPAAFALAVASALRDPAIRADRAQAARAQLLAAHSPVPAAQAWVLAATGRTVELDS